MELYDTNENVSSISPGAMLGSPSNYHMERKQMRNLNKASKNFNMPLCTRELVENKVNKDELAKLKSLFE